MINVTMLEEDLEIEIETILSHLDKYNQVIFQDNLQVLGFDNSLSFNYFALGIREILKNMLESKKINEKVKQCQWYKKYRYDEKCQSGATTRQRLAYIICKDNDIDSVDRLLNIKSIIDQLYEEYIELNKLAHIKNRPNSKNWETKVKSLIKKFAKFMTKVDKFERKFMNFFDSIYDHVNSYFTTDEPSELLSMATHCYDIDTAIDNIVITDSKDENGILLNVVAEGMISSTLQWGSDIDCRNGDGEVDRYTYPIKLNLCINFDILSKKIENISIIQYDIDNSSFYE